MGRPNYQLLQRLHVLAPQALARAYVLRRSRMRLPSAWTSSGAPT